MLEVENLMLFYENILAVNNVGLRCSAGQIVGLFGGNNAGKSSLMYAISGLIIDIRKKEEMKGGERITIFGKMKFQGEDILNLKPDERAKRGLVLCPERRRIFSESSVLENLRIGGHLATRLQARKTIDYVFNIFPALLKIQDREGGLLSGGEQQMLAIGRALMAQPKLLLLDEPLLGLSPAMQISLSKLIRQIREQSGISVLVTEQYARPLLPRVDYAYIMENGSLVLEGTRQELLANPDVKTAYFGV
jgi:branched-chain amino acid transport system ATP-binding protein